MDYGGKMPVRTVFQKDATATINTLIARAPLYRKRPVAPGEKKVQRFFCEMEHFSKVLALASRVRENQGAMRSIFSYSVDLKKEYGPDLVSGGKEPAVEMANSALHGGLFAGMAVRSDLLSLASKAKAGNAKRARGMRRLCAAMEIGLGAAAAGACALLGYVAWDAIASSGGSNYRIFANIASPAISLVVFGVLCVWFSRFEEKIMAAVCSKELRDWGLRAAADAWKKVERLAERAEPGAIR